MKFYVDELTETVLTQIDVSENGGAVTVSASRDGHSQAVCKFVNGTIRLMGLNVEAAAYLGIKTNEENKILVDY